MWSDNRYKKAPRRTVIQSCSLKVKGTSILETVISMSILLTILTLTFTRIDRVNASINPQLNYMAYLATNTVLGMEDLLIETHNEYVVDAFLVKKKLKAENIEAYKLSLEVYNRSGKLLYTRHRILANDIEL